MRAEKVQLRVCGELLLQAGPGTNSQQHHFSLSSCDDITPRMQCSNSSCGAQVGMYSGAGDGGLEKTHFSEVAHNEGHRDQRDADADRGKQFVNGVGQHERTGAGSNLGLDHGLAESHLEEQSCHVNATVKRRAGIALQSLITAELNSTRSQGVAQPRVSTTLFALQN